jgi:formylglycine-generating enzyme required for sulfatase activity
MSGTVWEWTNEWYDAYASGAAVDPAGAASGSNRVLRGGGCYDDPSVARVANRDNDAPSIRSYDLGFRLSRSAP